MDKDDKKTIANTVKILQSQAQDEIKLINQIESAKIKIQQIQRDAIDHKKYLSDELIKEDHKSINVKIGGDIWNVSRDHKSVEVRRVFIDIEIN